MAKKEMRAAAARLLLFSVWLAALALYFLFFLGIGVWHPDVDPNDAMETAWYIAYVLLPIVSAFGGFWFAVNPNRQRDSIPETVDFERAFAMFAITSVVHLIVIAYFVMYLFFTSEPFDIVSDFGLKLLVFFSTLAVLPVGWLLGDSHVTQRDSPEATAT